MTPPTDTAQIKEDGEHPGHANALPLRQVAANLFEKIAFEKQTLDKALQEDSPFKALSQLDRALVRMILTTTIRRLGQIDDMIARAMTNGQAPSPRLLQSLLRIGVAQIMFMDVPDHAVVNLSVSLAEKIGLPRQKGLVNAVLRRIAREGGAWSSQQDIPRLNVPGWMLKSWADGYGMRQALEAGQASLAEAPLDLSVKDASDRAHWAKMLSAETLPTGTLRLKSAGMIDHLPGFAEGAWWVQDAAAALPVLLLGDLKGKRVIDLCAAPGGKTMQLAASGAQVVAIDRKADRVDIIRRNLDRMKLSSRVDLHEGDGMTIDLPLADIVLVDAPCTATGTLRRNPDILLHRRPEDMVRMVDLQKKLLENAAQLVKPGGRLMYAVCSVQPEEGEHQAAAFLQDHPGFKPIPLQDAGGAAGIPENFITKDGMLRVLPQYWGEQGGMDGFFAAMWEKVS